MQRTIVTIALALGLAFGQGCASGLIGPFSDNDPITGGINANTSQLLEIPLPAGLQRYSGHGFQSIGESGSREGLEVLRGNINANLAAQQIFSGMQGQGWQLRLALNKNNRAIYVYDKQDRTAALTFRPQTMLTVIDIWAGPRLPDGTALEMPQAPSPAIRSIQGEEFGPLGPDGDKSTPPATGYTETWGATSEKDIQ